MSQNASGLSWHGHNCVFFNCDIDAARQSIKGEQVAMVLSYRTYQALNALKSSSDNANAPTNSIRAARNGVDLFAAWDRLGGN